MGEGRILNRFKRLSGEGEGRFVQRGWLISDICATGSWWRVVLLFALFSPFVLSFTSFSLTHTFSSPPIRNFKHHMVVYWVLMQSSKGSTLLDLMQQIILWHLLGLLTKSTRSAALHKKLSSATNCEPLLLPWWTSTPIVPPPSALYKFAQESDYCLLELTHTTHLWSHFPLICDINCSSLKPL